MFDLDRSKVNLRDQILFGEDYDPQKYFGGVRHFKGLAADKCKTLIDNNLLSPNDSQNDSPTAEEMYEYIRCYPECTCHGYAVSPDRNDYRISLEGVEFNGRDVELDMVIDFVNTFRYADELTVDRNSLYCWYD